MMRVNGDVRELRARSDHMITRSIHCAREHQSLSPPSPTEASLSSPHLRPTFIILYNSLDGAVSKARGLQVQLDHLSRIHDRMALILALQCLGYHFTNAQLPHETEAVDEATAAARRKLDDPIA